LANPSSFSYELAQFAAFALSKSRFLCNLIWLESHVLSVLSHANVT
jgi:hypothetical protein